MRVLFVGLGSISSRHIRNLCSVCIDRKIHLDIDVLRRKICELPTDLKSVNINQITELQDDVHYNFAFITNPTNLHYKSLVRLKNKADYFFIEKPIFENTGYSLSDIGINSSNAYIACPMRHTKVYKEFCKILEERHIFCVRIICSSYLPDWRPTQDYRKNYSAIKSLGGGVTLDLIHEIDYMTDLFGFPDKIINVHGKYSNLEIDSDDLSIYIASYKDKLIEVHLDYFGRKPRRSCEVFTSDGTFVADFINSKILLPDEADVECKEGVNERYINEIIYFLDFVSYKKNNINSPENALKVLGVTLGKYEVLK